LEPPLAAQHSSSTRIRKSARKNFEGVFKQARRAGRQLQLRSGNQKFDAQFGRARTISGILYVGPATPELFTLTWLA